MAGDEQGAGVLDVVFEQRAVKILPHPAVHAGGGFVHDGQRRVGAKPHDAAKGAQHPLRKFLRQLLSR